MERREKVPFGLFKLISHRKSMMKFASKQKRTSEFVLMTSQYIEQFQTLITLVHHSLPLKFYLMLLLLLQGVNFGGLRTRGPTIFEFIKKGSLKKVLSSSFLILNTLRECQRFLLFYRNAGFEHSQKCNRNFQMIAEILNILSLVRIILRFFERRSNRLSLALVSKQKYNEATYFDLESKIVFNML